MPYFLHIEEQKKEASSSGKLARQPLDALLVALKMGVDSPAYLLALGAVAISGQELERRVLFMGEFHIHHHLIDSSRPLWTIMRC